MVKEINQGSRNDPARKWLKGPGKEFKARVKKVNPVIAAWDMGLGESDVLSYAFENPGYWAVVADRAARNCARNLQISFMGTIGVILLAKKERLIPEVVPLLLQLREAGIHISDGVFSAAKSLAGE